MKEIITKVFAGLTIIVFLTIVFFHIKEDLKQERITPTTDKEVYLANLAKQIGSLQCGDSIEIASKEVNLQQDSIHLGETLFINNKYPGEDYIWRNSKSLYEIRLRNEKLKIKRFCDDEVATN